MRFLKHSVLALGLSLAVTGAWSEASAAEIRNIVIVHGAFADGSSWQKVSSLLERKGYKVTIVQEPMTSLEDDVAATRRVLALQDGPAVLVGHSYGGMVVTEAGNDAKVAALVYVAAFEPDRGESLAKLAASKPVPGADPDAIKTTADGYFYLDPKAFPATFAADLPAAEAHFLAHAQVFAAKSTFTTTVDEPAWKTRPSWAIVATQDKAINPDLERQMARRAGSTVREVKASHAVFAAKPAAVAEVIMAAAHATAK